MFILVCVDLWFDLLYIIVISLQGLDPDGVDVVRPLQHQGEGRDVAAVGVGDGVDDLVLYYIITLYHIYLSISLSLYIYVYVYIYI